MSQYLAAFRNSRVQLLVSCVALVVLVATLAFAAFPLGFLDGTAPFWQQAAGDAAEHIIGGRYFLADAWRLPMLFVPRLGVPQGTNIGLTDSIPLAALIAKLGRGLWGFRRPYLPIWILFCWLVQGPAGAVALYTLGVRRIVPLVLGGLLLVFTPVLLLRFGHAALCGQFLLLLALALHFASIRELPWAPARFLYPPLLVVALLVHVYLFAMVVGVALATLLHGLWTERLTVPAAVGRLAMIATPVVLTMAAAGYFVLGPIPMKPYGSAGFNLAAPFVPEWSLLTGLPGRVPSIGFESCAWVGAGMALLIAFALIAWRQRLAALAERHAATLVMAIALVVFAASFAVRLGPWTILGLPFAQVRMAVVAGARKGGTVHRLLAMLTVTDWVRIVLYLMVLIALGAWLVTHLWRRRRWRLLRFLAGAGVAIGLAAVLEPYAVALVVSNFQASARFVWVVLYLAALLAIAGIWQGFRPRIAVGLLAVALILQMADTAPLWGALRRDAGMRPPALPEAAAISAAIAQAREVSVVPTFLCSYAEKMDPSAQATLMARITAIDLLVSRWARPINSVRNSRMTAIHRAALATSCSAAREAAVGGLDAPGRLTIVLAGAPAETALRQVLATRPGCIEAAVGTLCHIPWARPGQP